MSNQSVNWPMRYMSVRSIRVWMRRRASRMDSANSGEPGLWKA